MKRFLIILLISLVSMSFTFAQSKGHWEVGIHYSTWNIDALTSYLEDNFVPELEYYELDKGPLTYDSNGNNYGIELRFFPGGKKGSFSIGISYEKNNFRATAAGSYQETQQGKLYELTADGAMDLTPHSFNLGLRWELFPTARVHPYFGFAVGLGALNGTLEYHTVLREVGNPNPIDSIDEEWTLKEALEEIEVETGEDSYPLSFFPILHVQVGVRGEIAPNIYLLAEAALYDGFILRGGLAYRF